jgi:hypothetical protein
MASNAITNPRMDRAFVRSDGVLTEYGYSVLARIIERVGGPVGDILDGAQLTAAIEALSVAPLPRDWSSEIAELHRRLDTLPAPAAQQPKPPDEAGSALAAIVSTLARKVNDLENAP